MASASLGHSVPFHKPENLQLSLSDALLYLHWLPGLGFLGCQKLIPKTRLTGDTARTACCLLPLLPPLPFAAELNRIFTLAPTPAAAEKPYWKHSSSKRQAGLKGS